mmetsp:Transcript_23567/g.75483  ORF Transcript_23567/g.75483 Transcript_23567/m.75483 type:complete len:200 (-) Transcript_23567:180-779(-)
MVRVVAARAGASADDGGAGCVARGRLVMTPGRQRRLAARLRSAVGRGLARLARLAQADDEQIGDPVVARVQVERRPVRRGREVVLAQPAQRAALQRTRLRPARPLQNGLGCVAQRQSVIVVGRVCGRTLAEQLRRGVGEEVAAEAGDRRCDEGDGLLVVAVVEGRGARNFRSRACAAQSAGPGLKLLYGPRGVDVARVQ